MAFDVKTRRRWLGILFLCSALLMLLAGETVLKDRLHDLVFLIYWMSCFGFTGLAVLTALLDAKENQRHLRQERRNLLENTLNDIQIAAKKRQRPGKQAPK
ncbi:MAG TPA: hypothetical protein VL361_19885 [Candidatus Limnocylindrales bacterium]|jgi:hypothetical protein|nr:hypothetical protein [Candidatus Limnocylindrales bacterium]